MTFHTNSETLLLSRHWWGRICVQQWTSHIIQTTHLDTLSAFRIWIQENELQRHFFTLRKVEVWHKIFPNKNYRKDGDLVLLLLLPALKGVKMCKCVRETYGGLAGKKKKRGDEKNLRNISERRKKKVKLVHQWAQWQHLREYETWK